MIEKIMKAVKSKNKKRGRNISIGAVVGLLLSCTAVMGAEGDYLWIKNDGGKIKFSTVDDDKGGEWNETNPYVENSWVGKTYINNTTLSGEDNGKGIYGIINYGVKLEVSGLNFINNGNISGSGYGYSYGILGSSGAITNYGNISGSASGASYGILDSSEAITNYGNISGSTSNYGSGSGSDMSYGIGYSSGAITNYGNISGNASGAGNGISDSSGAITNYGNISGSSDVRGFGVDNYNNAMSALLNRGVIYGDSYAIGNGGSTGTIGSLNNYGLLVGGGSAVYDDNSGITKGDTFGLAFKVSGSDEYTLDSNYSGEFGRSYDDKEIIDPTNSKKETYTIINAEENIEGGKTKGTKGLKLENGVLKHFDSAGKAKTSALDSNKKYILNGITDTLLVSGNSEKNALNNIVINAYKTAVAFDTGGGTLSLSGTIVNGGIGEVTLLDMTKEKVSILGSGNADALILQNTIVNGNINMQGGLDTLTIGNETLINGTIDGGLGDDTLNFVKSSTTRLASSTDDNINILHNISGFENMNVNTNVTLFEKTIGDAPLTVTGAENITIGAGGVLTLRIDGTNTDDSTGIKKIIGHALYGNDGTISSTGGKILLALNGVGENEIISFGDTKLDSSIKGAEDTSIKYQEDFTIDTTSWVHSIEVIRNTKAVGVTEVKVTALSELPLYGSMPNYKNLNEIYQGIISATYLNNFLINTHESFSTFLGYLTDIYAGNPYSYSSELSRKSMGMFRDIVTENQFRADTGKWLIHGGLTHIDGGTKDTYYGKGYYTYDTGSNDIDADTKITGAYMLGEYGISDTLTSGVVIGGNKLKSDLSNGSKVEGNAMYLGAYAKKYLGNLKVTAGLGFQYGDYDADRLAVNNVASSIGTPVMKYSDNYNDMTYDIYINGRYSHNIGDNLFLEPYGTLSYTYVDQDGANEGNKSLAIETDSKSFDYTTAKVGVDLKKVMPHEKGKSTLSAGVSYTRILDGADEEFITGRFKGGTDFDILVAHKNEHSIGLNAKYSLELENGILFDVKGTYAVERDSHNQSGKNKTKGEWIVGAGLGYKF